MVAFTDDDYTVRLSATPRSKVATVVDSDGDVVLSVRREGLRGGTWFTFAEPHGAERFHVRTTEASTGPFRYTTRRYPIVDAATDEAVADVITRWAGPFKRRLDVESPAGSLIATIATRSRLSALLRTPPFGWFPPLWFVVSPLTYDVRTPAGTRVATMQERTNVVGREFAVRMPYDADFPWIVVFAGVLLGGLGGFARRLP